MKYNRMAGYAEPDVDRAGQPSVASRSYLLMRHFSAENTTGFHRFGLADPVLLSHLGSYSDHSWVAELTHVSHWISRVISSVSSGAGQGVSSRRTQSLCQVFLQLL